MNIDTSRPLLKQGIPEMAARVFQIYSVYIGKSKFRVLLVQLALVVALHLLEISNPQPCLTISNGNQLENLVTITNKLILRITSYNSSERSLSITSIRAAQSNGEGFQIQHGITTIINHQRLKFTKQTMPNRILCLFEISNP